MTKDRDNRPMNTLRGHEAPGSDPPAPSDSLTHGETVAPPANETLMPANALRPPAAPGLPNGFDPTAPPPAMGRHPSVVYAPTAPPLATEETLAASDIVRPQSGPAPASRPGGISQARSVGEEMKGASIERFGHVTKDRFELLDELARGGLGRVFRARDPRTNRIVAIKEVLRPHSDIIARFAREALVTANLQHPAIVPVYEVGRWDSGEPFYAMKLVQGRTFDALLTEAKTLDERMALVPHLIIVADALAYAHSEHVIHRDLKPANVLVGAYGETVVIDWGLAKNMATGEEIEALPLASTIPPDSMHTVAGSVVGTPAYMPPEQARGEKVDERADVYAIGAMLYHVLAGKRPFVQARTMDELLELVANKAPQPIAELAPDAPPELIAIAEKAMAARADQRYATAEGLAHDLRAFQAGKLVAAHQYTTWELVKRWVAQHRGMVLTATVALGVLVTIGAIGVWRIAQERDVARRERAEAQEQRAEAQRQRGIAEERVADSLEELGRQAVQAETPDKALPLLLGAVQARAGATTPTLDILLGVARSAYAGLVGVAPAHPRVTTSGGLAHGGAWAITAGSGGDLRAWDLAANKEAWHAQAARLIALSPDGASILGVDDAGRLAVFSVDDGKLLHEWHPDGAASTDIPTVLAWAPDSAHFAAATPGGRVFLGAPSSPTLASLDPHKGQVWAAAFSPDGALLATGGDDGVTALRETATGKLVAQLADGPRQIASYAWIDAKHVAAGDDKGVVKVWDVAARRASRTLQVGAAVYGVLVGGGAQKWLAAFGDAKTATVFDLASGAAVAKVGGHELGIDVATVVGSALVTTDETGHAYAWNPLTGERLQALPPEGPIQGAAVAGDRLMLYGNGRVRVWSIGADPVLHRLSGQTARIRDLAWTPDGRMLWSASMDGTARGVALTSGEVVTIGTAGFTEPPISSLKDPPKVVNPHGMRSLRISPDGKWIATANEDGTLLVTELANPAHRIALAGHTGRVRRAAFARDGKSVFSVGDTTLRAWDLATGKQRASADLGGAVWDLALLDGDRTIATQNDAAPNEIRMWNAADLSLVKTGSLGTKLYELYNDGERFIASNESEVDVVDAKGGIPARVAFSAPTSASIAGDKIVVASASGQIGLYTWPAMQPIRSWTSGALIASTRARPDGRIIATAGDRTVRLWDPVQGRLLAQQELPVLITQLAWSPDGKRLAMAGGSGVIWIWELAPVAPAGLALFAACASPWRLDDTAVAAAAFDPASCAALH